MVHQPFQPLRETSRCRFPFTYAVPPETVGIPAGIDDIILTAGFGCGLDERQLFGCGGVCPEAVHVIVEDHRELFIVGIGTADAAPVFCHFFIRFFKSAADRADCRGDCDETLTRFQIL